MNALNVQVHDPLPVGMIVLNATVTPSNMAACQVQQNPVNVVDCTIPVLQSGNANQVTIDVQVFITAQSGTLSNEACVDPSNTVAEYNESNNCSTVPTTVVPPAPKLTINKTESASTLNPGDPQTYTLTVTNVGNAPTSGTVTVVDVLDSRLTNVSATGDTGFTCTFAASTETCMTSTAIANGQAATITITGSVVVPVPTTTAISNSASVSGGGAASATSQTVIASVGAGMADFTIPGGTVTSTPAIVAPGGVVTYQFTASNIGTADATGVTVQDTLSPASDVMTVIAGGTNGFTCTYAAPTVTCTGNLTATGPTNSTLVTVKATVSAAATNPLTNNAVVDPGFTIPDSNHTNNTGTVVTTVSGAAPCTGCVDLVTSILESPSPAKVGNAMTYVVSVSNVGDTDAIETTAGALWGRVTEFVTLDSTLTFGSVTSITTTDTSAPHPFSNTGGSGFNASCYFQALAPPPSALPSVSPAYPDQPPAMTLACYGDLHAGQGAVITFTATPGSAVASPGVITTATVDPNKRADASPDSFSTDTVATVVNP
jgi:uncharacterized repeat protein (TIGR01451 family)